MIRSFFWSIIGTMFLCYACQSGGKEEATALPADSAAVQTAAPAALPDSATFVGQVANIYETGLGPLMGVSLKNENGQELTIDLMPEQMEGVTTGKVLAVAYRKEKVPLVVAIRLLSEPTPTIPDYVEQTAIKTVRGKYQTGEQGDMGKYVSITGADGNPLSYNAIFDSDVDNLEKFEDQEVELSYIEEEKIAVLSVNPK